VNRVLTTNIILDVVLAKTNCQDNEYKLDDYALV